MTNTTKETTEDQTGLSNTVQSGTSPLVGQGEPATNEDHHGGIAPNETMEPALSSSQLTTDTLRGPAVLEGSEIPNSSEPRNAEENTTTEKLDDHQTVPPTVGATMTGTEPQDKAPDKEKLLGSSPTLEDDKQFDQVSNIPTYMHFLAPTC